MVADASALLEYLLGSDVGAAVGTVLRSPEVDLHAPALCDVEIVAGLRRALLARALTEPRARAVLEDYRDLPLTRHGHGRLLERILDLRANFSVYDGAYVALAEHVGGDLLTADRRLGKAVRAHTGIRVLP